MVIRSENSSVLFSEFNRPEYWYKVTNGQGGSYFLRAYDEIDAIAVAQLHGWHRGERDIKAEKQ